MNSQTHLTHKQLCDLVIASPYEPEAAASDAVHSHLHSCYTCMAELTALGGTLDQFHTVAHAVAQREFTARPRSTVSLVSLLSARRPAVRWMQPLSFALAAALLAAVAVPLTLPWHQPVTVPQTAKVSKPAAHPSEAASNALSDEALLEGIDNDLSASIPEPMQPLADPTASSSSSTSSSTQRTN